MKSSLLVPIAVIVLVVLGAFWYMSQNKTTSTPAPATSESTPAATASPSADTDMGEVVEVTVEGAPFKFTPNEIKVKKGQTVKITFKNKMGTHDLVLEGYNVRTQQLQAGQEETIEFVADKVGTYTYYCSVTNHRAQGMEGKLIVE